MSTFKRIVLPITVAATLATFNLPAFSGAQSGGRDGGDVCDGRSEVLVGQDNDNINNSLLQTVAPPPNQSLDNADILQGNGGCDVLIGLFGNDVLDGGVGSDILIGGTEQFDPNGFGSKDVIFGGDGSDINIWAPGDGSDAFLGGSGGRDAQVFGLLTKDSNNVPIISPADGRFSETGLPTVDIAGSPGFCRLEYVGDTDLGFEFLVRFFVRATGNLAVTVRLKDVEQVFCTNEAGGEMTYANLRDGEDAEFVEVSSREVRRLNLTVSKMLL